MSRPARDVRRPAGGLASLRGTVDAYRRYYADGPPAAVRARRREYTALVDHYYDLVTDLYLRAWGDSFHFAPRRRGESFPASLARHQRFLAAHLGVARGGRVLDLGCGVGGPMRRIAHASGARILGVNLSARQIAHGQRLIAEADLADRCGFVRADFMALPFADGGCDAAYQIEATAHAPDRLRAYREVSRVLAPGGRYTGFEWCLTARYDDTDPRHRHIRAAIEEGTAVPSLPPADAVLDALREAGFEILESRDLALDGDPGFPWYRALEGRDLDLTSLARTPLGRGSTHLALRLLERLGAVPAGASAVTDLLNTGADALVAGGRAGIFTPMLFCLARKPTSPRSP